MKFLLAISLLILLGGWGWSPSVPKCGDAEVTDIVKQIAKDEIIRQVGAGVLNADGSILRPEDAKNITYLVNAIRTTEKNDETGAFKCAAQLGMSIPRITGEVVVTEHPIVYTVEVTDDGEEFYVNVYGL